jgi:DNA-binding transcriptional MerR regulator
MLKIGDFSKLSQVSVKALRYYDEIGLLKPAQVDRFTGYRYYSADQLPRLNRLLALKDLGFSLEQIAELLDEELSPVQVRGMLRLKQAEIQQRVQEEQAQLGRVEARLRYIEQEGKMPTYDVILKKIEPQLVAAIRDVIPTYADQGQLWGELDAYLTRHKVNPIGACLTFYYDTEYKERDVDLEVCEPIAGSLGSEGQVTVRELPGMETMACLLHHGNFDTISQTYQALISWIEANGYHIAGPNREVYLRAVVDLSGSGVEYPADYLTDNPDDRLTEIQFPVEKV